MDNNVKKAKSSIFAKQRNTIIALAVIFAVLLCAYIFIIRPLMKDDSEVTVTPISLIWENEVESSSGIMMFKHIERDAISRINVHNPALLSKNGSQYVDWSIYRATEDKSVGSYGIEKGELYLEGYEYAPLNDNDASSVIAAIVNDAGFTLAISRVTDHTSDFSKYGLDFENDDEATYCEILTLDGESFKFYIGDKIPSGNAYYVRMAGKDTCLDKNSEFYGQDIENDSVYIYNCANVLLSPTDAVSPVLTYPLNTSLKAYFDKFTVTEYSGEEDDEGSVKVDFVSARTKNYLSKPISAFAEEAIYYTKIPAGYHSSTAFERLFENFSNGISGVKVLELATLLEGKDEETGKTYQYYGFTDEVRDRYFEKSAAYMLSFTWNGIENIIVVSNLTENNTYYVYSLVYNTICEVNAETLAFLEWRQSVYIDKEFFRVNITNCSKFEVSGKYFDFSTDSEKNVDASFDIKYSESDKMTVISDSFKENGAMNADERAENFRTLYQILLFSTLNEKVDSDLGKDAQAYAEIRVSTKKHTVSLPDPSSEDGEDITIDVDGMTRVYRFYRISSGRTLMTTQNVYNDGSMDEETGAFYLMTSRVEMILSAAENVANDLPVSRYDRP